MKDLKIGSKGEPVRQLQAATNRRLKSRHLAALVVKEDGELGARTFRAITKAAWALGAMRSTLDEMDRKDIVPVGAQRMILNPGRRSEGQQKRGKIRIANMIVQRKKRAAAKRREERDQGGSKRSAAVNAFLAKVGTREQPPGSNGGGIITVMESYWGFGRVPWCFKEGTLVSTPDGLAAIEDLRPGDVVHTATGAERPVFNNMTRTAERLTIKALGLDESTVSPEHPYLVRRRLRERRRPIKAGMKRRDFGSLLSERVFSGPEWVEAGDLRRGDMIALPRMLHEDGEEVPTATAYMTGRWLADGWVTTRKPRDGRKAHDDYFVCGAHPEREEIAERLDDAGLGYSVREYPTVTQFALRAEARVVLSDCGRGAAGKHLPKGALGWSREAREALFRGYLDGDGHERDGVTVTSSVSRKLTLGIVMLARSLGYQPAFRCVKRAGTGKIEGRDVEIRNLYVMQISGDASHETVVDGTYIWSPVRSVEAAEPGRVYNLTVADEHTFIADGVAVHNCGIAFGYHAEKFGRVTALRSDVASVQAITNHARARRSPYGKFQYDPGGALPGSAVIIGGSSTHVAMLVEAIGNGKAKTVEGNTSFGPGGPQSNGGCIAARVRNSSEIFGVATMSYGN